MKTRAIILQKESMKFSVGHFTIFSATERENIHGHNYTVSLRLVAKMGEGGMCCNYDIFKHKVEDVCREWNEHFIVPANSPYLTIQDGEGKYLLLNFADEEIPFLKRDVKCLPIQNASVEEFARLVLLNLVTTTNMNEYGVTELDVTVCSEPGQGATASWQDFEENDIYSEFMSPSNRGYK